MASQLLDFPLDSELHTGKFAYTCECYSCLAVIVIGFSLSGMTPLRGSIRPRTTVVSSLKALADREEREAEAPLPLPASVLVQSPGLGNQAILAQLYH